MFCSIERRDGQTGDQVFNKKTMMMFLNSLITFMSVLARERERERFSLPLAGSNYWLSLDPWNKIADRNLSLSGLCRIFLSLAFPSTPPLLWIPFTWADKSSMWGGEKKKHLHILDSPVDQYKSFFFRVGNYKERHGTEKTSRAFSSLKRRELW